MYNLFLVGESDIWFGELCGLKFEVQNFKLEMDLLQQKLSVTYN